MIGADTTFLIDFFKGIPSAVNYMKKNKELLCLCEPVVYEFLCGNLTPEEVDTFLGFVLQFPVFAFDQNAALKASSIFREGKKLGKTISHPDAIIAGCYLANQVSRIVTRNAQHFSTIPISFEMY